MENISFDFTIKEKSIGAEEYHDYVRKEYEFFRRNSSGDWVKADSIPHATDESGRFSLKQGQKAVFRRAETHSEYEITEDDSPFWECSSASYYYLDDGNGNPAENYSIVKRENDFYKADTNEKIEPVPSAEDLALYKFERAERINRFRPVVYFEKKISALSDASEMQWLRERDFGFVLKADGNPAANKVYWIVDRAGYEGSIPEKLEEGKTDENGRFTVKAGQIIALFPGEMDSVYKIEEDTSKTYKKGSNTFKATPHNCKTTSKMI